MDYIRSAIPFVIGVSIFLFTLAGSICFCYICPLICEKIRSREKVKPLIVKGGKYKESSEKSNDEIDDNADKEENNTLTVNPMQMEIIV